MKLSLKEWGIIFAVAFMVTTLEQALMPKPSVFWSISQFSLNTIAMILGCKLGYRITKK